MDNESIGKRGMGINYKESKGQTKKRAVVLQEEGKGKVKAIPLQTWTGPEGSKRLRLPDIKTIGT
jgi:hypothetical protein